MKKLIIAACVLLAGCSVGQVKFDNTGEALTTRHTAGIPWLLSETGTATPISPHMSLTAGHVADDVISPELVLARHPVCDVAFIAWDNSKVEHFPAFARPRFDKPIELYGYSANTQAAVSGTGTVVGTTRFHGCIVYRADAGGMQGMSGGPVIQDGNVVGIIVALDLRSSEVLFVGMDTIGEWMAQRKAKENPKDS